MPKTLRFCICHSNRLRKIMRKTLNVCEQKFQTKNLIQTAIVPRIVESLGYVYPELEKHSKSICDIFQYEDECHKAAVETNRKNFKLLKISPTSNIKEDDIIEFSNFSLAFRDVDERIKSDKKLKTLPVEFVFHKLYLTYGLNEELIQKLAAEKKLNVDMEEFEIYKTMKKQEAKSQHQMDENILFEKIISANLPPTAYQHMYEYVFDNESRAFAVRPLTATVAIVEYNAKDDLFHVVLDRTNFYHTAGGQDSDIGQLITEDGVFDVQSVTIHKGYVVHTGRFLNAAKPFQPNEQVNAVVNASHRTHLSQHHSCAHLLQAALKKVTNRIVFQESSHVSAANLKCQYGVIGNRISLEQLENIEQLVCRVIQSKIPMDIQHLAAHELYAVNNLTTVPGATYPDDGIRVLHIKDDANEFESIEPCCGTHAGNTGQLEDFCFTSLKVNNSSSHDIRAIAGRLVEPIKLKGKECRQNFEKLKKKFDCDKKDVDELEAMESEASQIKRQLSDGPLPYITSARILTEMKIFDKQIRTAKRAQIRQSMVSELVDLLATRTQFLVHALETKAPLDSLLFVEAEQMCNDLPVILLNVSNNRIVQGRASIPLKYTDGKFNAKHWLDELARSLNIKCSAAKNNNLFTQSTLNKIPDQCIEPLQLEEAVERTKDLAAKMFGQPVSADDNNRRNESLQLKQSLQAIRSKLKNADGLNDVLDIMATVTNLRNEIKVGSYSYEVRSACQAELAEINDQIIDTRHEIEK